ncbi:GerMN domain-containing protein [Streptomyces sp. NA04227]|uniref:LpqB family beta-propeller domain-containing protein n=1 Tax=Streptomyces sp. NA04227 TaxID=2742136 RepID=UPI0015907777|nr:LpqB family beta-propeller domain-containing protein [Streptomyces sp. NA04227]QKW10786.1 GerMN domain-containing protein [Streptomyces sp. NA04227]
MPDHGDVRGVEASPQPDGQVRVFAMPPPQGAAPTEIVQGFLEALTSDDPRFEMARKYLTEDASRDWRPESSTTVLADGPSVQDVARDPESDGDGRAFALTGTSVARVDAQRAYAPNRSAAYSEAVHLTQVPGADGKLEWRIDRPPSGVVLGESDFQRIYRSVSKYFYASGVGAEDGQPAVVSDPVYVRERIDPVTQTVRALLEGPTSWLSSAVRSSFPPGTGLQKGTKALAPDDQNRLEVPLSAHADSVGESQCHMMAAQILFSIDDLTPAGLKEVELLGSDGSPLCSLNREAAEVVAPHRSAGKARYQYFLDKQQRLVRLFGTSAGREPDPAPGAFGDGDRKLRAAAVSREEDKAAGVSLDGRSLYVGSLVQGAELGDPMVTSRAKAEDDRLTPPSWDGRGDLWVADRDPRAPRLYLLHNGAGEPSEVRIAGLGKGHVQAVRVAADGVRIALLVEQDGKRTLRVGRVHRTVDDDGSIKASVHQLRVAAPQMEDVRAMSWAGGSRLVVVGREEGGVQQIRYVQADGSAPEGGVLPGLNGVEEIAASEDESQPLVAHSDDGIVRLPLGAPWQTVGVVGTAPVYPG